MGLKAESIAMKYSLTAKQAVSGIRVLLDRLDANQTLLAQIVNDPENSRNGKAAAIMFRSNADILELVKGRLK